jgi:two-component system cell cycle sensor histidine kinase/response regulator CckA
MNRSEAVILTVTGLLQLAVAAYGLRLTHMFGVARVGWSLFAAFALLALVHLFEAVTQYHDAMNFGLGIEVVYAFISFLLIAGLAHLESVLKERRRLEHQARKLQALGQLAEGITHDFNNVISAIQGYSSLLLLKPHDPDTTEALQQICAAVNRAGGLTRQLLAFGRGQSGQIEFLNLNTVIESLTHMLRQLIRGKVLLDTVSEPNLPLIVGDVTLVEEVIVNLVVNARDAMPAGGKLTISAGPVTVDKAYMAEHRDAKPGEYVCMRVRDTGSGITPEVMRRIFEPYFTTKPAGKGTGLGLATVQRIAKQHSGWVEVDSTPGAGSEFRVYFHCAPHAAAETPREPALGQLRLAEFGTAPQMG